MAIQVNGTQVIGNSRELTNIESVDATTAAAITAAGVGGGGSLDITASGTIADGRGVILKSDGTVEAVGGTSQVLGTEAELISGTGRMKACYSPNDNKIIVVYNDDSPGGQHYPVAQVGTISGSSISFGSKVVLISQSVYISFDLCWQSTTNKAVFVGWPSGATYMKYGFGTISGTSTSWTSFANTVGNGQGNIPTLVELDNTNMVAFGDSTGNYPPNITGYVVIADTSGSPGSHGTTTISSNWPQGTGVGYNPDTSTIIVKWWDTYNGGDRQRISSGTYSSGTSFSLGSSVALGNTYLSDAPINYDYTAERNLMQGDLSGSQNLYVLEANGTSVTIGSPLTLTSGQYYRAETIYSAGLGTSISLSSDASGTYARTLTINASANTVTAGSTTTVFNGPGGDTSGAYASGSGPVFALVQKENFSGYAPGNTNVYYPPGTNLSADTFLGLSDGSYTNGQTATVNIVGGVNDGQSGMTPGTTQYVQGDGTISSTAASPEVTAGLAISATEVLVKG